MTGSYQGVIQQDVNDRFYQTKKGHGGESVDANKAIPREYCLKDPNNGTGLHINFWYQGAGTPKGPFDFHLKCSLLNKFICDLPAENPNVSQFKTRWADPAFIENATESGRVACDWPKEKFLNTEWIKAYTDGVSSGGNFKSKILSDGFKKDPNLDDMYTNYCSQKAIVRASLEPPDTTSSGTSSLTLTPIDPLFQPDQEIRPNSECPPDTFLDGENMTACSFFKTTDTKTATDSPQILCNVWEKEGTQGLVQGAIKSYCDINKTRDCLCLNPSIDPVVKELFDAIAEVEGSLATSRGCWFKPCGSDDYLITSDIKKEQANCDLATKCSQVINIANSKNINLNEISQFLNCNVNGPPTPSNKKGTILGIPTEIFIFIVILVVVLLGIIIYMFFSGGTKSTIKGDDGDESNDESSDESNDVDE